MPLAAGAAGAGAAVAGAAGASGAAATGAGVAARVRFGVGAAAARLRDDAAGEDVVERDELVELAERLVAMGIFLDRDTRTQIPRLCHQGRNDFWTMQRHSYRGTAFSKAPTEVPASALGWHF